MKSTTPLIAAGTARIAPTWRHICLVTSMVLMLFTTFVTTAPAYAAPVARTSDTTTFAGTPNTAPTSPSSATNTHKAPPNPHPYHGTTLPATANTTLHGAFHPSMKPVDITLQPGVGTSVRSSDQALDISVPTNAISTADVTTLLGSAAPKTDLPHLIVTQVAAASGSTNGGIISLGTYLFQIQDGHGHEIAAGKGLAQPITVTYYWPTAHPALPLDRFALTLNGSHPVDMVAAHLGANAHQPATAQLPLATSNPAAAVADPMGTHPSLHSSLLLTASSTTGSFDTNAPEGYFGKPDQYQNDLHTGDLTTDIPLDIPAGPGGLTPPLHLAYSSAAVSATHNVQAAAPWVGDGWSLDPGAITWSESLDGQMPTGHEWENSWSISDPYGTSGALIPPSTDIATYYNDSTNVYYNSGTGTYPHPAVQWHTATESHAKIISYVGSVLNNWGANAPCFRVWLPNGIMEEFGCTYNSLQWYPVGTPTNWHVVVSAWKLDMIVDPSGNQIHYVYDQDMATDPATTQSYPQDPELNSITWDAPGCHNAQAMCTGSAWAPLMQVVFSHTNTVTHPYAGAASCGPQSNRLRCDDPAPQQSGVIDIGTPLLTQTQVLNDIQVNVVANNQWNNLRNYHFSYGQAALSPNRIDDPGTGHTMSVAGYLLLDQIQETGVNDAASPRYPYPTFQYAIGANDTQYYEDSHNNVANQRTDCGPAWNNGKLANGQSPYGCLLWSRSYNGFYMTEADNGEGLQQTFGWTNMRTNQHDPAQNGNDWTDPTTCNAIEVADGANTPYPCDLADDNGWSHIALTRKTVTENSPTSSNANNQTIGTWNYTYHHAWVPSNECSDCGVSMYWGNTNSQDYQDYYNGQFRGFAYVQQVNPDGGTIDDSFYTTQGWGVYDNTQVVACYNGHGGSGGCANENAPDSALTNAASGRAYEEDVTAPYNGSDWPLLTVTKTTWQATCPPATIGGSPAVSFTAPNSLGTGTVTMNLNWDHNLVAEVDPYNPVMACDVQQAAVDTYTPDGTITYTNRGAVTTNNTPYRHVATTYDSSNWYGQTTQTSTTGNDLTTTPMINDLTRSIWNDAITTPNNTNAIGTFIVDRVASTTMQDGTGTSFSCSYPIYDGQGWAYGAQSTLTTGLQTEVDSYASCVNGSGYGGTGGAYPQEHYTANGDPSATVDADANAGVASHKASTGACTGFTTCTSYDSVYGTLPTTSTNALNQSTTTNYTTTAADGFGLWPSSRTDANGQTTSMTYDALGRTVSTTLPGETTGETTTSLAYTVACNLTGADSPCLEVDTTQRLDASTTVLKRDFYDGEGQHVESRTAAPGGQDVVQYALYDNEGRAYFQSQPYFVTAYTGVAGKAAYSLPDVTKVGTTTTYDALGRVTISTDANGATTTTSYSSACAPAGTNGDQACYSSTTTIDANGHKSLGYTDALGRAIYAQSFTGTGPYTLYRTTTTHYDVLGHVVETDYADGTHKATATYDGLQHETTFTDPDLGTYNLGYDPNGNLVLSIDPRGTSGTLHLGYDGLNRLGWQSTHGDGSSPLAGYYYDNTTYGGSGVGRLTSESFASGPNQSVSGAYYYGYDARGQKINEDMVLGTDHYLTFGYNDAGQQTTLGYPDGDVVTTSYGAQDWLSGVTEAKSGTSNTLLNTLSYTGANGASMLPTSATVDNGVYSWNLTYDTDLRLKETKVQQVSTSSTLFDQTRAFDAVGNVTTTATTLPAGTDNQKFCYDEQNRLVWAGSQGTPSCGGTLTPGTLNTGNVRYTQTNSYDVLDRLTTGPLGSGYTYGDTTHLDGVTSAPTYSASYDAAGSMTGRNGQVLGYDALRRLVTWQNQATNPTQTASYAYNGSGERVQQSVTSGGATTTTSYIGSYEEVSVTGGTTTTTKYYSAGLATVVNVNGTLSYLVNDTLGSVSASLTAAGGVQATELYSPYGQVRYSSGTMPTSYGYTKQRQDPSGLNYDHARYYDASVGQFISADAQQGPNRYAYVVGNPETMTDPTGNFFCPGPSVGGQCINIPSIIAGFISGVGKTSTARRLERVGKALEQNRVTIDKALSKIAIAVEGSHLFNTWLRKGQNALRALESGGEDAAKLADKALTFKWAGRIANGLAAALDFGGTAYDYYQNDTKDPTGLRFEKSLVAGAIHATIVVGGLAIIDGIIDAPIEGLTAGLATPLAVGIDVGIDTLLGGVLGAAADTVVNDTPIVGDVTDVINSAASTAVSVANTVSTGFTSVANTVGSLFSGW